MESLLRGAEVAAVVYILEVLMAFDPDKITDWRVFAVAIGAGLIRAVARALITQVKPAA